MEICHSEKCPLVEMKSAQTREFFWQQKRVNCRYKKNLTVYEELVGASVTCAHPERKNKRS